jgi:hypothetical protein
MIFLFFCLFPNSLKFQRKKEKSPHYFYTHYTVDAVCITNAKSITNEDFASIFTM